MSRKTKDRLLSFAVGVAFATVLALGLVKSPDSVRSETHKNSPVKTIENVLEDDDNHMHVIVYTTDRHAQVVLKKLPKSGKCTATIDIQRRQ